MNVKRIVIIRNPKGGSASNSKVVELQDRFKERGVEVEMMATSPEVDSAAKIARQVAADDNVDLVIAVGGDGTACGVASGLRGTGKPMAVFPGGTGNLFARNFYSLPTTEQFVEMVMNGRPQAIDMIRADYTTTEGKPHEQLFMVGFGVGEVSDAISTASPLFKRIFGQLFYALRVFIACLFTNYKRYQVAAGGSLRNEDAAALFALNVTPPGMHTIARGCNASDHMMDVVVFRAKSIIGLVAASFWLALGKPERSRHYHRTRTERLAISTTVPMLPNIDGDPAPETTDIVLTVEPGAVQMILS